MSTSMRPRSTSAPITQLELHELNKYKDKRICKEDLEIFIRKYEEESKSLKSMIFGLPAEMLIIKNIITQTKSLMTNRTPISDANKEILSHMIQMNKEYRSTRPTHELRLRDSIIYCARS